MISHRFKKHKTTHLVKYACNKLMAISSFPYQEMWHSNPVWKLTIAVTYEYLDFFYLLDATIISQPKLYAFMW